MTPLKSQTRPGSKAQRRSKRLKLVVPVEVIALEGELEAFREAAQMLSVNAHGGLVMLAGSVKEGQTLRLVNRRTTEQQQCRVVSIGPADRGKSAVGIEFVNPALNFWQISFPPVVPRMVVQSQN